jgi:hypothetical protein
LKVWLILAYGNFTKKIIAPYSWNQISNTCDNNSTFGEYHMNEDSHNGSFVLMIEKVKDGLFCWIVPKSFMK